MSFLKGKMPAFIVVLGVVVIFIVIFAVRIIQESTGGESPVLFVIQVLPDFNNGISGKASGGCQIRCLSGVLAVPISFN